MRTPTGRAPRSSAMSARSTVDGRHGSAAPTTSAPRDTSSRSTAASASATRFPGSARSIAVPCDSTERTRAVPPRRSGNTEPSLRARRCRSTASQSRRSPFRAPKTRGRPGDGGDRRHRARGIDAAAAASAPRNAGSPARVVAEHATIAAPSSADPASAVRISSSTRRIHSGSTRSDLVSATTPPRTPSSVTMSRCSRVCGMMPSSAATTSIARSTPVAPASIVRTNASCPGTSTIPSVPENAGSSSCSGANPSSMVIPRRFSSGSRSVSTPVSAFTSAVLPWSIWPAVPRITGGRRVVHGRGQRLEYSPQLTKARNGRPSSRCSSRNSRSSR